MASIRAPCGGAGCGRCLACLSRRSALAPLALALLSETRLAELAALAGRRDASNPGPGAYCPALPPSREVGHHRAMTAADGPRPLAGGERSTRARWRRAAAAAAASVAIAVALAARVQALGMARAWQTRTRSCGVPAPLW